MDELTVAVRAAHFLSVLALFGEFAFMLGVARPALRRAGAAAPARYAELARRRLRATSLALATSAATSVAWLIIETAAMSGAPFPGALAGIDVVLVRTLFGRVWQIRFALAVALCALLAWQFRSVARRPLAGDVGGTLLAAVYLASLALTGHANAERGAERYLHLCADALHLIAAGAWVGALPGLVFALRRAAREANFGLAALIARRFSALGLTSVSVLLLSGIVNSWYLLDSLPALFGTHYGRLLCAKLALFGTMVAFAAINRLRLAPLLEGTKVEASARMLRNAIIEMGCGVAVVVIVAALGVTVPAAHSQILWPFAHTLSWDAARDHPASLLLAAVAATAALAAFVAGIRAARPAMLVAALTALVVAVGFCAWRLAVPAYPTTYLHSPLRYAAASIIRGAASYAQYCSVCHGSTGHGDGPAALSLADRPADLTEHLSHHREGTLYWWISHGIAGTPMPGFGDRLSEAQVWDLIDYLRAQADAWQARALNEMAEPWRPIAAPDFTFQVAAQGQEALAQQRGRSAVLLVLYRLPDSLSRLRALTRSRTELQAAGVRILAIPMNPAAPMPDANLERIDPAILALPEPSAAAAYALLAHSPGRALPAAPHAEFLIDRQGYLRARWTSAPAREQIADLLGQIAILNHETPHIPKSRDHAH